MTSKTLFILKIALPASFLISLFEKYIFNDWQFLGFLAVIIMIDTITGFAKHVKAKTISSNGFGKLFTKFIIYSCTLVMTHVVSAFTVGGEVSVVFEWFDNLVYSGIILREAISILENIAMINNTLVPSWILKRLKEFDSETGKGMPVYENPPPPPVKKEEEEEA